MKFSIQTKVFLIVLPILIVLEGFVIGIYVNDRKQSYIAANTQRFEMLGQNILFVLQSGENFQPIDSSTFPTLKEKFIQLCEQFYERHNGGQILHIAVIDIDENFIAHSDKNLIDTKIKNFDFTHSLGWRQTRTAIENGIYHTLTPILDPAGNYLGVVDVGYPKSLIDAELQAWLWKSFRIAGFFLLCSCIIIIGAVHFVVSKPVKYLTAIGEQLIKGNFIHTLRLSNRGDEIASIGMTFVQISNYLRDVTGISEHVATGRLHHEIQKRSKRDTLSVALQDMLTYLQSVAMFASKIASGDLTVEIPLRSDADAFGRAMRSMRMGLQRLIRQIRESAEQLAAISTSIASLSDQGMNIVASGQNTVEKLVSIITQMGMSAEEIATNMDVLSASVEQTSASVTEMTNSISSIASSASELEKQTEETITALDGATGTLENVAEKAGVSRTLSEGTIQDALEGQEAVEQVTSSMDTIQQTNARTVETITRFAKQTEDIDTILDVIEEITQQSGLLALNASIIAAQAGSHGRGFAVIADEMRSLADKVSDSTKDIAAIVQTVQQETEVVVQEIHCGTEDIDQGVTRTQHARKMLEKIIASAQRSSSVVTEIVSALEGMQDTLGGEMKAAMEQVHTMTASITRATSEQKSSTYQMNEAVEHIRDLAVQTHESTSQQLEGVQQVFEVANDVRNLTDQNVQSSQHIEEAAGDLNDQAKMLLQTVDRFKLLSNATPTDRPTQAAEQVE